MDHKILRSLGLLSAAAACLFSAQTVFAAESWDFEPRFWDGQSENGITGSAGGVLNAQAWAMAYGGSFEQATFSDQGTNGFGILHNGESTGSPNHALDNVSGYYDFVLFEFDGRYAVESATAGWTQESTYDSPEVDFYYWGDALSDPTATMAGTNLSGWTLLQKGTFAETTGSTTVNVNSGGVESQYWLVAANTCGAAGAGQTTNPCSPSTQNDAFKLLALAGTKETPTTETSIEAPEPATALLLAAALPFLRRRWLTK